MPDGRVIVIGGGIAGLSAASELCRLGCEVTLIEARPRLGGRIHTVKCGELPIELGAEFIHGTSIPFWAEIQAAGLSTHEVPNRNQFFERGQLRAVELWDVVGEVFERISPREPDESVASFLAKASLDDFTRRLTTRFVEGFHAAHPDRLSVHAILRGDHSAEQMAGDRQFKVDAGYSAVVDHLDDLITARGGVILTNAIVRRVQWQNHSVTVHHEHDGRLQVCTGCKAIVTLPLGVLKARAVQFEPGLPDKVEAAEAMEFGNVVKTIFVFSKRWWPDPNFGFIQSFDHAFPTWWSDPRGSVLTGWAGGPRADALLGMSAAKRNELAISSLSDLFRVDRAIIEESLVKSFIHDWSSDPWAGGAYSYIPVHGLDLPKTLAAPVHDTLFFAGESTVTDAQMGTVFGAFGTGYRAAREVLAGRPVLK